MRRKIWTGGRFALAGALAALACLAGGCGQSSQVTPSGEQVHSGAGQTAEAPAPGLNPGAGNYGMGTTGGEGYRKPGATLGGGTPVVTNGGTTNVGPAGPGAVGPSGPGRTAAPRGTTPHVPR